MAERESRGVVLAAKRPSAVFEGIVQIVEPSTIIALVIIGLLAGGVGGLLGVGGSIVMIPAMTEVLGPDQHLYQAAAMIVNFFVVVPAVLQHRRARAIDLSAVKRLVPLALVAVLIGVGLSDLPIFARGGEKYLRMLFGLFLLIFAGSDLAKAIRRPAPRTNSNGRNADNAINELPPLGLKRAGAIALPTGIIAGLFGVGGGILAVPLQRKFLGLPIRNAIANSATIIIATSLVGATAKNWSLIAGGTDFRTPLTLALSLVPTAIIGSFIGSRLTHVLPVRLIKQCFLILLLVAAVRMMFHHT